VRESDDGFVVEFESDGKSGYIGVAIQDVGGTKYVCKTTGLSGVKSPAVADKHLKASETLAEK